MFYALLFIALLVLLMKTKIVHVYELWKLEQIQCLVFLMCICYYA